MTKAPPPTVLDDDGLTHLQKRFCDRYLELLGTDEPFIKKTAALDAGYSPGIASTMAYRALRDPACVAYIGKHLQASAAKVGIDKTYVLFKAVLAVEMAEGQGNVTAMMKALDTVAKHVDVNAFTKDGIPPGAGGFFAGDLTKLSREQLLALASIVATMGGHAPATPDA
jgi:hypothetical protein